MFTKKYRHFLPQGKNGKMRRRKKLRGDKGVARGSLFSGQDIVIKKNAFYLKINNKLTAIIIVVKFKLKDYLITKEFCNPIGNGINENFNRKN